MALRNSTPLIALNAVVLDTETTGLDPRDAWIVEIGAVRLNKGRIDPADTFRRLVRPGVPIPPASTAIHHIDDMKVAAAPGFEKVWPELLTYMSNSVLIGHTLGFDLAVFKRECERAGLPFHKPRTLDTRLLAEVAEPDLAGYTLEGLANWLGVGVSERHAALGDALTTARVFTALVPKLREGGIRTLGEAMQACRALTDVLDEQHRAGWVDALHEPSRADVERALAQIDSYPYRHRIRDLMRAPPKFVTGDAPLRGALALMVDQRISSLFVRPDSGEQRAANAAMMGIVTERDVMRALAAHGEAALSMPVDRFTSRPLATVKADAFVYRAIGRMDRHKVRHLGVIDESGQIVGALSARDLLRLRAGDAIVLGDEIERAEDVHAMSDAWAKLPYVTSALVAEGVGARDIAAVISREMGSLTHQATVIAERRMLEAGRGAPPCPYAVALLGSGGRGESLLALDQDNALIFAEGAPGGEVDRWFETLGTHIADILHEVGIPYCKGGVMAKNAHWRGSVETWRGRIGDWIRRSNPQDLLSVDIFFDMREVHGDGGLANMLWQEAFDAAKGQSAFAKLLVDSSGSSQSALNFFGGFKTDKGRIDLKRSGLFGIVSSARALAICHHVVERSTPSRLHGVKAMNIGGASDLDALIEAHVIFLDLMVAQQTHDIEHGIPPSNAVAVKRLSRRDRERLRWALDAVRHLDGLTRDLLFKS